MVCQLGETETSELRGGHQGFGIQNSNQAVETWHGWARNRASVVALENQHLGSVFAAFFSLFTKPQLFVLDLFLSFSFSPQLCQISFKLKRREVPVAGPGSVLFFRYQLFIIVWALLIAGLWVSRQNEQPVAFLLLWVFRHHLMKRKLIQGRFCLNDRWSSFHPWNRRSSVTSWIVCSDPQGLPTTADICVDEGVFLGGCLHHFICAMHSLWNLPATNVSS